MNLMGSSEFKGYCRKYVAVTALFVLSFTPEPGHTGGMLIAASHLRRTLFPWAGGWLFFEYLIRVVGTGTGIAPFRAFIQHIYDKQPDWQGQVRLFYGARTGTETLYRNDLKDDLSNYYDRDTFEAFEGLSKRPWMDKEDTGLSEVLENNAAAIWKLMQDPNTHVYIAGLPKTAEDFYRAMTGVAGSTARWRWTREEMMEQGRWSELLYS